ncbi:MAG TPA: hypothetical protein ENN46_00170 [Candidatus Woesearchaeota archaeon]|nr:hypothetical protein [Candidatus Woesearchaeota archaeon]
MVDAIDKIKDDFLRKRKDFFPIDLEKDELTRFLGFGLPRNSLLLMEGRDGSGKSVISQRFCYSFLKEEVSVSYISSELNTVSFIEQMDSLSYDIKEHILDGKLLFIPVFPIFGNVVFNESFVEDLIANEKIFSSDVIIFDTFSFIFVNENFPIAKWMSMIKVFKHFASKGKLIIISIDPEHLPKEYLTVVRSLCDIYFELLIKAIAGETVRVIDIKRFKRPAGPFTPVIPFRIVPGHGLIIEIATLE